MLMLFLFVKKVVRAQALHTAGTPACVEADWCESGPL